MIVLRDVELHAVVDCLQDVGKIYVVLLGSGEDGR